MNIESERIDELVRRLAILTGEDIETALERTLAERLSRIGRPTPASRDAAICLFFERLSQMPVATHGRTMRGRPRASRRGLRVPSA